MSEERFVHKVPCRCCDDRIASELKLRASLAAALEDSGRMRAVVEAAKAYTDPNRAREILFPALAHAVKAIAAWNRRTPNAQEAGK